MKFLNIFSRNTQLIKKETVPEITIDFREKNCLLPFYLRKKGFKIKFQDLNVDYLVKGVAIERKTIQDFINSVIDKRLLKQLKNLQNYSKKILIIEGIKEREFYSGSDSRIHPNAIRGLLLSIQLKYNIPIIYTENYKDTAEFISVLSRKKSLDNSKPLSLNITKRNLTKKQRLQFILEGFPGIGPKSSEKILKKFKNLKNFFNASLEELQEVLGKKAEKIKEIIDFKCN